jgi:tetratricopeptide (TPR) repeat protein
MGSQAARCRPRPGQTARGLYQQGFAHFQLKQYGEAAVAPLAKIASLEADAAWKTRAAYLLGESHNMLKQFDKAELAYASALPGMQGAEAAECRYRLAMARFLQGKHEAAMADFTAYLGEAKPDPEKPAIERQRQEARLTIARCKLELKDYKGADKDLQALAASEDEGAAKANLWWARVHSRQGNYDRAAEILEPATAKFQKTPDIDDLNFDLANALMNRKEPDWKKAGEVCSGSRTASNSARCRRCSCCAPSASTSSGITPTACATTTRSCSVFPSMRPRATSVS